MTEFQSVRTNQIVFYQGQQHVVTGLDVRPDGVFLHLQRIEPQVKSVTYNQVKLIDEVLPKRLSANLAAQKAWEYGMKQTRHTSKDHVRQPYTRLEVSTKIKGLLLETLKEQKVKAKFITQSVLDKVVGRIAAAQGYLTQLPNQTVKSLDDCPDWREIAAIGSSVANAYNRSMLDHIRKSSENKE